MTTGNQSGAGSFGEAADRPLIAAGHRDAFDELAGMVSTLLESRRATGEAMHIGQILDRAFDEILILDPRTLRIQYVSAGVRRTQGRRQGELLNANLQTIALGYPIEALKQLAKSGMGNGDVCFEAQHTRRDGSAYPVDVRVLMMGGGAQVQLILLANNISGRRHAERMLEHMAVSDRVTGLPNRHHFDAKLAVAVRRARNSGCALAVMVVEIDRLREIRHVYGQKVADCLTCEFGERIRRAVGASELVAHLGGDQFAVVLEDYYEADKPRDVAVEIHDALDAPFLAGEKQIKVTASSGITYFGEADETADDVLARAGQAVSEAAMSGVRLFVLAAPVDERLHAAQA
jgi:diguanylate cyclase (GGDEF)-like protein